MSKYGDLSSLYFLVYGLNAERYGVSVRLQSEYRKIRTRKTPNLDTFHAVTSTLEIIISPENVCNKFLLKDTHRERLVFHSIQYSNGWLAASDLFDMFTQSVKFYTFHYQYRYLKDMIHQIDCLKGRLLLSANLRQNLG